jgi:hypothetical protein
MHVYAHHIDDDDDEEFMRNNKIKYANNVAGEYIAILFFFRFQATIFLFGLEPSMSSL